MSVQVEEALPATLSTDSSTFLEPRVAASASETSQQPGGDKADRTSSSGMRSEQSVASKCSTSSQKTTVTIFGDGESPPAKTEARTSQIRGPRISAYPGRIAEESHEKKSMTRKTIQQKIQSTKFYHGNAAARMRALLHGKPFVLIMTLSLLIALFLPEAWVLCGVNSNTEIDIILTLVMGLFAIEFVGLTALDATYFLSFFFLMDIVGTVSMIFDISYLVGLDNTRVQTYTSSDSGAKKNLMLLRAARAARVGARAGRLSRVLRILRFLPFLSAAKEDRSGGGIAASISRQLANLLATRVACLTIILVMVIPAFDILSFPQDDHALQAWVERLGANLDEKTVLGDTAFEAEIDAMVTFFDKRSYGPYIACVGMPKGDADFTCLKTFSAKFTHVAPGRSASALWVHTDKFMVGFNMHQTQMLDKGLSMVNIFFIICIMVFSGLALSNVVTELAVRPLERLLKTVREIAQQVFKMSTAMMSEDDEDEGEEFDINTSTEMKLLERVVAKLAIIADLQNGQSKHYDEEDMGEEDIGVLNMMQGKDVSADKNQAAKRRASRMQKPKGALQTGGHVVQFEEIGIAASTYNSSLFNSLVLSKQQLTTIGAYAISRFHDAGEGFVQSEAEKATLQRFVVATEKEYLQNPFHNFCHAIDVLHGVAKMMNLMQTENFLSELEQYSLLVGALGHDLGHPGVNNGFLSEVGHDLAIQYNDLSPLENMHVSKLYCLVQFEETNVFAMLSKEQYKEVRKYCIETILHTDMMGHQAMVKDLSMLFQVNSEIFKTNASGDEAQSGDEARMDIFCQPETKLLMLNNILHSADVSNPCRAWEVTHAWAHLVLEEFFAQGDQEKMLGVPVQFLNDRDKLNRPNSQIGFLEFMIAPFFAAQIRLMHGMHEYGDNLQINISNWEGLWEDEVKPEEEAKAKVRARVEKVKANIEEAKQSSAPILVGIGAAGSP